MPKKTKIPPPGKTVLFPVGGEFGDDSKGDAGEIGLAGDYGVDGLLESEG